jgi:hypothetical protein
VANYFRSRVELVPEKVRRVLLFWDLVSLFSKRVQLFGELFKVVSGTGSARKGTEFYF